MNFSVIKRTIGYILLFESVFFFVPMITAACYWEKEFFSFLICSGICATLGGLCMLGKSKRLDFYAKEGFVTVALSWIVISIFGSLPFIISGAIPNFIDALFETVSGFTTTGSTILTGERVDGMAKSLLIWRSFTHWVGGMGVLVFVMAFLPLSGARNLHMMQAEATGASVSKLVPKVRHTAIILYGIYFAMTILQFILLLCGGIPVFDALNISFATAGTGGFAVRSSSILEYSSYIQIVTTVFMLLFSINFASYYLALRGKIKDALNTEIKAFLLIVIIAIAGITLNLSFTDGYIGTTFTSEGDALKHSAFAVASIISTTGFATVDFNLWPSLSKIILLALMFVGACAGSTGGGIKVSRHLVLFKGAKHEVRRMIHPKQIKKITLDGKVVEHEVVRSINAYLVAFLLIFTASLLLVSIDAKSIETSFSAVAATINNVGPGLGEVGPSGNFASFSWFSKLVFIFDMLAGRLEIFPMLILFSPATWKK